MKALNFSLTEAILQLSSTIFTVSNLNLESFSESNEDVFFLMYNIFNDFHIANRESGEYYGIEMNDRAAQKHEITLILFLISIAALVLFFIVLFPVVASVNS